MNKKEAIVYFKNYIKVKKEVIKERQKEGLNADSRYTQQLEEMVEAFETVLNLLEKKDKIINSIKEYAQQEIDFATEDIEDYIDDDREGNKDIIGELKEWREHWKDIIRIMNNEKTYMDFEYKLEEEK